jgi:hypothetical protein
VKAALQNKQKVTKKTHQKGSKKRLFNNPQQILRRRKYCSENSDILLRQRWWKNILFGSQGQTLKECSGGNVGSMHPTANLGP